MRSLLLAAGALSLMMVLGCHHSQPSSQDATGEPRYVTNWSRLKVGMSQGEVRKLLGMPAYVMRYRPETAHVPRAREFGDKKEGLKADIEAIFGEPHLWQYGGFDMMDAPEDAFLVYFDAAGRVVRWRQALTGPHASTTRPVEPAADNDALQGKTPSELWETPTLQRKPAPR